MKGIKQKIWSFIFLIFKKDKCYVSLGSEPDPKMFPQCIRPHSVNGNSDNSLVVPEGCFSVYVGKDKRKFFLPIAYLSHPVIRALLRRSAEEYGVSQAGVLRIPCDVKSFQHVLWLVHSDPSGKDKNTEEIAKHYYLVCGTQLI
ncbi:hypothetical protein SUGI_0130520 [Cryptomeria japonica]|uniref:auxin-responsive protein SAUR40 n=1 Tax=Cryptomeria japonica TaxID=3369 RepID=UPI002408BED7|nr:auxin-responsive protein SAUR40 [Cryptomeria japonica]GLJ10558.1 hypothetical protein SUGI_0130520 [Cryptomeria japonica]